MNKINNNNKTQKQIIADLIKKIGKRAYNKYGYLTISQMINVPALGLYKEYLTQVAKEWDECKE